MQSLGYIWVTKNSVLAVIYAQIIWPISHSFPLITPSKAALWSTAACQKPIEQVLRTNITAPRTSCGGLCTLSALKNLRGPLGV